jgi:hypothetical protein
MRRHFRDVHPVDLVQVPKEGRYARCDRCGMQVSPLYPRHQRSKECQVGVERHKQRDTAISSALALRQQFLIHGVVLERVEVFKYLGQMMSQDNDNIRAIRAQLWKARATWARVGQVLRSENASPHISARFYQAIVQAILLYGSETWVLSQTALAWIEGFHICAAYRMAKQHKPKRGPCNVWIYPRLEDVLRECGMKTMEEYIAIWKATLLRMLRPVRSLPTASGVSAGGGPYHTNGGGSRPERFGNLWDWKRPPSPGDQVNTHTVPIPGKIIVGTPNGAHLVNFFFQLRIHPILLKYIPRDAK